MLQAFESLEKVVVQYYSTEDQYIISCPTQDQVSFLTCMWLDCVPEVQNGSLVVLTVKHNVYYE